MSLASPAAAAPTVAVAAPTMQQLHGDAHWQTELFTLALPCTRGCDRVSARQAFQDALYGRALIVDLRSDGRRRADGAIAPALSPLELRPGADLGELGRAARIYVIPGDGDVDPAEFAALSPGRPPVLLVDGGFAAWVADGLPVTGV